MHTHHQQALINNDYDIELASLYQFGQDIKKLLEQEDYRFLHKIISSEVKQADDSVLARELQRYLPEKGIERVVQMLNSLDHS